MSGVMMPLELLRSMEWVHCAKAALIIILLQILIPAYDSEVFSRNSRVNVRTLVSCQHRVPRLVPVAIECVRVPNRKALNGVLTACWTIYVQRRVPSMTSVTPEARLGHVHTSSAVLVVLLPAWREARSG
jgi:hypothetical protein